MSGIFEPSRCMKRQESLLLYCKEPKAMTKLNHRDGSCSAEKSSEEYNSWKKGLKVGYRNKEGREKTRNLDKSQEEAGNNTDTNNSPTSNLDLLVCDSLTHIPHQMAQTVERVVSEREAGDKLGQDGKSSRPSSKASSQRGRLEVPAKSRSDQV